MKEIYFVLGGPGSGKGTFCSQLMKKYPNKISFYSAGDLLRNFSKTNCSEIKNPDLLEKFKLVDTCIKQGQIVPAEVTVALLFDSITKSHNSLILIDGFPRNNENFLAFKKANLHYPKVKVLGLIFLKCRLTNKGRGDVEQSAGKSSIERTEES